MLTERTPPSRNSSEGGVEVLTEEPPRLAFRAREGWRGGVDRENPSVSQFERGRGWWWGVDKRNTPSVSHFERGRGWMQQHDEEKVSLRRVGSVV